MIDYDGLRWVAMGFTEFYWVFRVSGLGYERLRWVAMGFTEFYRVSIRFFINWTGLR